MNVSYSMNDEMRVLCQHRGIELEYGGYSKKPASDQVLSRIDIVEVFENSREKDVKIICVMLLCLLKCKVLRQRERSRRSLRGRIDVAVEFL